MNETEEHTVSWYHQIPQRGRLIGNKHSKANIAKCRAGKSIMRWQLTYKLSTTSLRTRPSCKGDHSAQSGQDLLHATELVADGTFQSCNLAAPA